MEEDILHPIRRIVWQSRVPRPSRTLARAGVPCPASEIDDPPHQFRIRQQVPVLVLLAKKQTPQWGNENPALAKTGLGRGTQPLATGY